MSKPTRSTVLKEMSSGAIGMSVVSAFLNPLDVVKVRFQQDQRSYSNLKEVCRISLQKNGVFRGLVFPGLTATVIRDVLNGAFRVGLYKEIERFLFPPVSNVPFIFRKVFAGVVVGSLGAGLWSHTDLIKTRMQIQMDPAVGFSSTLDAYRSIYRQGGFKQLYQGVGPNMLRASIITTAHVGSYDASKDGVRRFISEGPFAWTLCGLISALVTTTAAAPVDLVRTRIMISPIRIGGFSTAQRIIMTEGIRGLFRGWLPSFFRFGPHFTLSWPLIELSRKYLFGLDSF
jgi:dicarboxylate transporter 10